MLHRQCLIAFAPLVVAVLSACNQQSVFPYYFGADTGGDASDTAGLDSSSDGSGADAESDGSGLPDAEADSSVDVEVDGGALDDAPDGTDDVAADSDADVDVGPEVGADADVSELDAVDADVRDADADADADVRDADADADADVRDADADADVDARDADADADADADVRDADADVDTGPADPCATGGHAGCSFFAVDLPNYGQAGIDPFGLEILNPGTTAAVVTVVPPSGGPTEYTVAAGAVQAVSLGSLGIGTSPLATTATRVASSRPVIVAQANPTVFAGYSSDASLLLPYPALGTHYVVSSWPTRDSTSFQLKSFVAIVGATGGSVDVNVRVPYAARVDVSGSVGAGETVTATLLEGQVMYLQSLAAGSDLSGTVVTATGPVAVFAGHECANVPTDVSFCDHMEEQQLPVDALGAEYVLTRFQARGTEPTVFRVMATEPGTTLTTSPSVTTAGATIRPGVPFDITTTRDFVLTASAPVAVTAMTVSSEYPGAGCDRTFDTGCAIPEDSRCDAGGFGDPTSVVVVPPSLYRTETTVLVASGFLDNYINVVAPAGVIPTIDGIPMTSAVRVGAWDVFRQSIGTGGHTVLASSPVGTAVYGYGCGISWGYFGGIGAR
ncbi:MAG: IgGFc-binding protein [Myxococcales bacterium]|nr:IgGFc-binding protein [Myxococcales bacterium]